jgi:hypothetical protein
MFDQRHTTLLAKFMPVWIACFALGTDNHGMVSIRENGTIVIGGLRRNAWCGCVWED